jgi:hypothetical protein
VELKTEWNLTPPQGGECKWCIVVLFFFAAKKFTLPEVNNKVPGQTSTFSETCDFYTESKYESLFTGRIFTLLTGSTALPFTVAGASLATRPIQILPMNQHA